MFLKRVCLACAIVASAIAALAQEEQDPNGRELRLLAWVPMDIPLSLGSGTRPTSLALSTDQFALIKGKQLPGGKTMEVFAELPDPTGRPPEASVDPSTTDLGDVTPPDTSLTGRTKMVLYASAPWPSGSQRAIAFLLPDKDAPLRKGKLLLLPDSLELHPEHTMRAINLTEVALGIRLGDKQARVPVRGELICPFDPGRLRIDIAVDQGGDWNVVTGSYLATARHYRCFALIRPQVNPNPLFPTNQPDIQSIFDQTSPLPPRAPLPTPSGAAPREQDSGTSTGGSTNPE